MSKLHSLGKPHILFIQQPEAFFVLSDGEKAHIKTKHGANQLMYAVSLKFFECEWQFLDHHIDINLAITEFLAQQLDLSFEKVKLPTKRLLKRFRTSLRLFFQCREITKQDKKDLAEHLKQEILPQAPSEKQLFEAMVQFCRKNKFELFAKKAMDRFLASIQNTFENNLFKEVSELLSDETKRKFDLLLEEKPIEMETEPSVTQEQEVELESSENLNSESTATKTKIKKKKEKNPEKEYAFALDDLKKDTSRLKKSAILYEIKKYEFLKNLKIPEKAMGSYQRQLLIKYERRVRTLYPSHLKEQTLDVRYAELAMFCFIAIQKSTDILTELLLKVLHRIKKKAEHHTDKYILANVKKVGGKFDTLLTLTEIAASTPQGIIEQSIYPKVPQEKLKNIAQELKSKGDKWYQSQVRLKALSLYKHGYRPLLQQLLKTLTFETDGDNLKELLKAIDWIKLDVDKRSTTILPYKAAAEVSWGSLLQKTVADTENITINLNAYELSVLEFFEIELSIKNIWVQGAYRYQDPIKDLPADFENNIAHYCNLLGLPEGPNVFIAQLKKELEDHLIGLNENIPNNKKVKIVERKSGAIVLSPSKPQSLPTNLELAHQTINTKWPNTPLIEAMKEVALDLNLTKHFTTAGSYTSMPIEKLQRRIVLCLYAMGSNTDLKSMATSNTGESYADLCYVKNRYINHDNVKAAIKSVVDGIDKIRDKKIWGDSTVSCACDSKKLDILDQNLMSAWHGRYRTQGVMLYWHVDKNGAAVFIQYQTCSSSEVASMMKGVLQHDTEMDMDEIFVDTHGQSCIGFAFSHLLDFDLLPRIKGINKQKLSLPSMRLKKKLPHLLPALSSQTINWTRIGNNYRAFILHYAAALKTKTVDPDILLKRLCANNAKHPGYQALLEIGKAKRTIFLCRYLSDEKLRIHVNEMLNLVERLNGVMEFLFHGKWGEINSNDKYNQELAILCLHLLQVCVVYFNTLLLQEVLNDPDRKYDFTDDDLRALNPLIHEHFNIFGIASLDMTTNILSNLSRGDHHDKKTHTFTKKSKANSQAAQERTPRLSLHEKSISCGATRTVCNSVT